MTEIPRRILGRTGLEVTVLGYGAMELRDPPRGRPVAEEDAGRILNAVLDSGITFIDTSIDYGLSEERIGRHIAHRRDEYVLASKCGCIVGFEFPEDPRGPQYQPLMADVPSHSYTRDNIVAGVEQSLRRLRTDYLDLVQVHISPSVETLRAEDVLGTLDTLREQGKVRYIGMSGILPELPDQIALGVFDVFQIPYSAIERDHEDLISAAAEAGAGVIIRGGAGKGTPGGKAPSLRHQYLAEAWAKSGVPELIGDMDPMEFTIRFTISHPDMTTTIVGTANPDHLRANVAAAAKGPLPAEMYAAAKKLLDSAGIVSAGR